MNFFSVHKYLLTSVMCYGSHIQFNSFLYIQLVKKCKKILDQTTFMNEFEDLLLNKYERKRSDRFLGPHKLE